MIDSGWFLDTGSLNEIKKWKEVIGGITTNQLILFEKENIYNIPVHLKKVIKIVGPTFPISVELPDSNASIKEMINLASRYNDMFPDNIVIKVPILPDSVKGLKVISKLVKRNIRTNATIGINEAQLTLAAEASRGFAGEGSTYISLFWGRAAESEVRFESRGPRNILISVKNYLERHGLNSKIIVGSIRKPSQVIEAFDFGADIVTVTPQIFEKIMFTSRAKETVDEFDNAFLKVKNNPKLKII
jgi:transaldolase